MLKSYSKKKLIFIAVAMTLLFVIQIIRLGYLMIAQSDYYLEKAQALHDRERTIKAKRGVIYDRNGVELAGNKSVCSVSVIRSQIEDSEMVIRAICKVLELDEETVRNKVEANTMRENIKSNVDREVAEQLADLKIPGIIIDEDYKRYYPYEELASKVLGFTGADNQGIVGLEVKYDSVLSGTPGSILTLTDAHGYEIENEAENRIEPVAGDNLYTSIDVNMQTYAQQAATKVLKTKGANRVSIILMNPQNGEIYAMVNAPEYNLNEPYTIVDVESYLEQQQGIVVENPEYDGDTSDSATEEATTEREKEPSGKELQDALNGTWRNFCINDTYEPGSTFKIVTATAALETGVVSVEDGFFCPGYRMVEDRRIRCHKTVGHGSETFKEGLMNSCNPVFIDVGSRVGVNGMYEYFDKLGLFETTGVDLPGEANSIMHKKENVKAVELATMSFGQSFQITPLQLLRATSAVINGGTLVTPHFAMYTTDENGKQKEVFTYEEEQSVISAKTSETMKELLEAVVAEGSGSNGGVEGFRIGGKTATSEKLPRGNRKYISSFIGFAPANHPQIIGIIMIDEPEGVYYGGTIAAPVMAELYENILPYMGIEATYEERN